MGLYFDKELAREKEKAFAPMGFKNQRRNLRQLKQVGKSDVYVDERRGALLPGKRLSASGKEYWETRKNRSDSKGSRV